jgi:circadian clock protein KaiB
VRAIANARLMCDTYLEGRYRLAVVDVHDDTTKLVGSGMIAAPTLVKNRPLPARRIVGDLSRTYKVLQALELPVAHLAPEPRLAPRHWHPV